jgi:hypothetical protein
MTDVGTAINNTFHTSLAEITAQSGGCSTPVEVDVDGGFDYIMTMEDMEYGQRIANYTIQYQAEGSSDWLTLVPASNVTVGVSDRPDGLGKALARNRSMPCLRGLSGPVFRCPSIPIDMCV